MDQTVFMMGLLIFFVRVLDVSFGTMRTIATVPGRMVVALVLGMFEIVLWVTVVGTVITQLNEKPILLVFHAFFATVEKSLTNAESAGYDLLPLIFKMFRPNYIIVSVFQFL